MTIIQQVLIKYKILNRNGKLNPYYPTHTTSDISRFITGFTSFLPNHIELKERIYYIINNISVNHECPVCNVYIPLTSKIQTYCSTACVNRSDNHKKAVRDACQEKFGSDSPFGDNDVQTKSKQTNLERYGHENPFSNNEIKDKIKKTNLDRYGHENPFGSDEIKDKIKKTNLDRYGHENPNKNKQIRDKISETNLERYGHHSPFGNEEIQNKIMKTNVERYGCRSPLSNDEIKDKIKKTNLERYGHENPFGSDVIRQQIKQGNLKKYGVINPTQKHFSQDALQKLEDEDYLITQHHTNQLTLGEIADELNVSRDVIGTRLKKFGIEIRRYHTSSQEREICAFLDELGVSYTTNSYGVANFELDIIIPDYNLAIEFNGLYWHALSDRIDKKYHLRKTQTCEDKGIRLLHIFADEWSNQNQKCKDTIRHLLQKSPKGVYARNTTIREISWKRAKDFLNKYHLLNAGTAGKKRIGAFDKDDNLIGVMVFGNQNNEGSNVDGVELKRFITNKKNNPGLGSKMFKWAVNEFHYTEVIAFVDRRWFTGLVKQYIGFELVGVTEPALWWTDYKERYHRRFTTKTELQQILHDVEDVDNLTKKQMLSLCGYYPIYDSGKLKLKWNA
jgi:hypothetical protein